MPNKVTSAHVDKLDLDFECRYDLVSRKGIRIDETESFKKSEKVYHGLQSVFFGSDFSDEQSFEERYRCKCGKYIGKMYEGQICEKCGTTVQYVDIDLSKTGWIILDRFKVFSPIYAVKLQEALGTADGEKVLTRIIEVDIPTKDKSPVQIQHEAELLKKHPFCKKGMRWLIDNIDEVLDYYEPKKPAKAKLFKELRKEKDKMFTSCIPVYSSVLRIETPGEKDKKLYKLRINTIYLSLIRSSNAINELCGGHEIEDIDPHDLNTIDRYLYQMHLKIICLFDEVFQILSGKKGVINSRVIAGRYNFSARMIISSSSGYLRADEVELPYIAFMELFRYEIINMYAKLQNCTMVEAQNVWKRGTVHFDPILYRIMCYMCEHNNGEINILINRNPSINFGSFLCMKVKSVKADINEKTMRINTRVIQVMAADFDGDQLNVFRIIGMDLGRKFAKTMNPRYNLYIDRVNGRVNKDMMPLKDEVVGFWLFNNC